jgi:hypothetical protein
MNDAIIDGLIMDAYTHYNSAIQGRRNRRIEKLLNVKSKIIVNVINESIECPICLQTYNDGVITRCGHKFCKTCISRVNDNRCPYCRQ